MSSPKTENDARDESKDETASAASTPLASSNFGDNDVPGTSTSDAIRRNLEEMDSSFFDSPTARKSKEHPTLLLDTPESIHKDGLLSSGKSDSKFSDLGVTPLAARTHRMALKEQENVVNKYQKENFDLKFRLYYMEKRLQQLSNEEAKRMIQENVELNTYKATATKEIKALNKKVRELQFEVNDKDARIEAQDRASRMQSEIEAEHDGARYDTEQELSFMRDRISTYEIEILRLRDQVNGTGHDDGSDRSRPRSNSGSMVSLRRHEAEIEALEIQNGQLRDALSETKMENHELSRQIENLGEDMAKLYEHVNANADDSILERSASRSHARGASNGSARDFDGAEAEIEQLELANGQLRDAQSILRMQNIELTNQNDFMTEELNKLQNVADEHTRLQVAYDDLKEEYRKSESTINELREEFRENQSYEDQLVEMQNANAELQAEFQQLHTDKQKATEWAKVLTERIEALTSELTDFADMKAQFEELQDAHKKLQDNLDVTVKTLQKNEQRQILAIKKNAMDKMQGLEDSISRKEAELAVLRSENTGLNQHEGEMYTRMDEMAEQLDTGKKEIEAMKLENQRLAGQVERERALRHSQKINTNDANMVASVRNARIGDLETSLADERKRNEALQRQFKARLEELEKRYVQEREGRITDRRGARARLLEGEREIASLKETIRKVTNGRGIR